MFCCWLRLFFSSFLLKGRRLLPEIPFPSLPLSLFSLPVEFYIGVVKGERLMIHVLYTLPVNFIKPNSVSRSENITLNHKVRAKGDSRPR